MKRSALIILGLSLTFFQTSTQAQSEVNLTATSANVSESGTPVSIRILRWSTDEERTPIVAALNPPAPIVAAEPRAAVATDGRAARGASRGAAAGRGRAGRGGRGGAPSAPLDPVAALTAAIGKSPTLGYIWTNEVTGYAIKYAYHASLPEGSERIILATDRRLGVYTTAWKPVGTAGLGAEALAQAAATDYEFTFIEMRLDSKGAGEGKTSLTTKVVLDNDARTIALENYAAAPAILQHVKR